MKNSIALLVLLAACGGDPDALEPECDALHPAGACPATGGRPQGWVCHVGLCVPPDPRFCGDGFDPCWARYPGMVCAMGVDTTRHAQGFCCPLQGLQPAGAGPSQAYCRQ